MVGRDTYMYVRYFLIGRRCPHCKALAPIMAEVAVQLQNDVAVGSVDCEADPVICRNEGIEDYPTLVLYSCFQILNMTLTHLTLATKAESSRPTTDIDL